MQPETPSILAKSREHNISDIKSNASMREMDEELFFKLEGIMSDEIHQLNEYDIIVIKSGVSSTQDYAAANSLNSENEIRYIINAVENVPEISLKVVENYNIINFENSDQNSELPIIEFIGEKLSDLVVGILLILISERTKGDKNSNVKFKVAFKKKRKESSVKVFEYNGEIYDIEKILKLMKNYLK